MGSTASLLKETYDQKKPNNLVIYDMSLNYYTMTDIELIDIIYNASKKYDTHDIITKELIECVRCGYSLSNEYYHCFAHATFVFQTIFIICERLIESKNLDLSHPKFIGFLLMGLCHDLGHRGTINTYLDASYKDVPEYWGNSHSYLEYMHFTKFNKLLEQNRGLKQYKEKILFDNDFVMELFRYTNLSQHFHLHKLLYKNNNDKNNVGDFSSKNIIISVLLFADISSSSRNHMYRKTVHTALNNEATCVYQSDPNTLKEIHDKIANNEIFVKTFVQPLYNYLSLIVSLEDVIDVSLL